MYVIIFILFVTNLSNAKILEPRVNILQVEKIKKSLEKHCFSCPDKSLEKFENATIELDKIIKLNPNVNIIEKMALLSDLYEQLIYKFYHDYKSKQIEYRNKQYNLLKMLSINAKSKADKFIFWEKLKKAIENADYSLDEMHESEFTKNNQDKFKYFIKLGELSTGISKYVQNIKAIQTSELIKRAEHIDLSYLDLKFIDKKIVSNQGTILESKNEGKNKSLVKVLLTIVKKNNLDKEILMKIARYALSLKALGYARTWKKIDDIIWWCEVRSTDNKKEQLQFLNNQMLSTRKLDALAMLIELGEVETIEKWSKKLNFENSPIIFKLAIKQAKLRQATLQNNKNLANLFKQELSQSLTEIIQQKLQDNALFQQHIQWLIIQTGTHRHDKNFKQILENLVQNNLYYNNQTSKNLSKSKKLKLSEELETKLKISDDAKYILTSGEED